MSIPVSIDPMGTLGAGGLPPEYEARQYLASWQTSVNADSHHSIDTGRKPTLGTRWEIKLNVLNGAWGQVFMGCLSHSSGGKMFIIHYAPQNYVGASQGTKFDNTKVWDGARFGSDLLCVIDNANGYVEVGNGGYGAGDYGRRYIGDDTVSPPSDNIRLFSRGTRSDPSSIKIYWSRIYEDGVLVQDLVPCVRKADMRRGMYDLVGRNFLVNLIDGYDFDTEIETHES